MKKKAKEDVEKRSISAPPEVFRRADEKMKSRMITSFSEYVRDLIRRDVEENFEAAGRAAARS